MAQLAGQGVPDTTPSGAGGFVTPGIQQFAQGLSLGGLQGSVPTATVWDQLAQHFAYRYPRSARPLPSGLARVGGVPTQPIQDPERFDREREMIQRDRSRLKRLAREAGLDPDNAMELAEFWLRAVQEAEQAFQINPVEDEIQLVWQILERWAKEGAPGTFKEQDTLEERKREWYGEAEPYEETRVDERINLTDPQTARELVKQAWAQRVGREPNDEEMRTFVSALNVLERRNPTRTTTVTRYSADDRVLGTESTTEGGGVSPGAFALEFEEDELEGEERAYTAGVTYAPVIEQLVGGF